MDQVDYDEAEKKVGIMEKDSKAGSMMWSFPYRFFAVSAYTAALATIPLCFSLDVCQEFNRVRLCARSVAIWKLTGSFCECVQLMVTTEVPPAKDLETWLEVRRFQSTLTRTQDFACRRLGRGAGAGWSHLSASSPSLCCACSLPDPR